MTTPQRTARLGHRIRDRRVELGLTQDQLAEISDVSQGAISRIEHGASPSLASLQRLRSALALPDSEWLLWLDLLAPADDREPA